jgi:hypothetical protein
MDKTALVPDLHTPNRSGHSPAVATVDLTLMRVRVPRRRNAERIDMGHGMSRFLR